LQFLRFGSVALLKTPTKQVDIAAKEQQPSIVSFP
jgi:hypothetical protein